MLVLGGRKHPKTIGFLRQLQESYISKMRIIRQELENPKLLPGCEPEVNFVLGYLCAHGQAKLGLLPGGRATQEALIGGG